MAYLFVVMEHAVKVENSLVNDNSMGNIGTKIVPVEGVTFDLGWLGRMEP